MSNNNRNQNATNMNQQSAINYQQQHDLMQVAALMFPSLFMAQQSTSSQPNFQQQQQQQHTNIDLQQSGLLQLQQQHQQTDQTNKLLASLIQQQTLNQTNTNNWLQLLNDHANSSPAGLANKKPDSSEHVNGYKSKTLNNRINGNVNRSNNSSNNIISKANNLNKMSQKNNPKLEATATTKAIIKNCRNSSMFSIKDLIGGSEQVSLKQKEAASTPSSNKYLEYLCKVQQQQQHQQIEEAQSNQNDRLMMFAAAAAVMQNADTEGVQSTSGGQSSSYNWLLGEKNKQNGNHTAKKQMTSQGESKSNPNNANNTSSSQKTKLNSHSTINAIYEANNNHVTKNSNVNISSSSSSGSSYCQFENGDRELEAKLKVPLKLGWRRETIVKEVYKNGVKGDVIYYSPCSKKLRTFQEIERVRIRTEIFF